MAKVVRAAAKVLFGYKGYTICPQLLVYVNRTLPYDEDTLTDKLSVTFGFL